MGRVSFKPKEIISAILVFAVLVALISGIVVLTTKRDKKVVPSVFSRGALDGSGKHVDTDTCLYTEELIQCRGLNVAVDFEAKLEYEIYFYRSDESFIGSTGRLTEDYYGADVIDLYADSGITRANYLQYVLNEDPLFVHPNEAGMDLISATVVKALMEKYR